MAVGDPETIYGDGWMERDKQRARLRAQEEKEQEIFAREQDADVAMMQWMLGHDLGKRFLSQLLIVDGGVLVRSYEHGDVAGGRSTEYREGARSLALQQLDKLTAADPRGFVKVMEYQIAQAELLRMERANA